jgi:hypothetical protein
MARIILSALIGHLSQILFSPSSFSIMNAGLHFLRQLANTIQDFCMRSSGFYFSAIISGFSKKGQLELVQNLRL